MNDTNKIPTVESLKSQARRLRDRLAADGHALSHGHSLEIIANQLGYKDWNTLFSAAGNRRKNTFLDVGERVSGSYLGRAFNGEIIGIVRQQCEARYRVTIHFDQPVDVVEFESFSSFRQRVSCTLGKNFMTAEKTSNGLPQLYLDR